MTKTRTLNDIIAMPGFSVAFSKLANYTLERQGEARIECFKEEGKRLTFGVRYGTPTTMEHEYASPDFLNSVGNPLVDAGGIGLLDIHTHPNEKEAGFSIADLQCAMSSYQIFKDHVFGSIILPIPSNAKILLWRPSNAIFRELELMKEILPKPRVYDHDPSLYTVPMDISERDQWESDGIRITGGRRRDYVEELALNSFQLVNDEDAESLLNNFGKSALVNLSLQNGLWTPTPESTEKIRKFTFS